MKVVLLPGLDGTGILFKPFIDLLPNIETLVIPYPSDLNLSYKELTSLVIGKLPDEDFILIGESFSGPVAYQIALSKPKHLRSVIFVATFISNPRQFFIKFTRILPISYLLMLPMPNFIVKSLLLGMTAKKQVINLFKKSIKQVSPSVLSFRLREIGKLHKSNQPCEIQAIYIQAINDKLVPSSCIKDFKDMCTNLNVFKIDGPHFIMQAKPQLCADIVANEIRLITSRPT